MMQIPIKDAEATLKGTRKHPLDTGPTIDNKNGKTLERSPSSIFPDINKS
jgi:hypothetical protein